MTDARIVAFPLGAAVTIAELEREPHSILARLREREPVSWLPVAGANRDPAIFASPDQFDISRDNARLHVTFAQGPHVCIGMHLARLEAQVALERLLARLPGVHLDPARPSAPRGLVFRKPPTLLGTLGCRGCQA